MPQSISTEVMVTRLEGMLNTGELTPYEEAFVLKMKHAKIERRLTRITSGQVDFLASLHDRHFA